MTVSRLLCAVPLSTVVPYTHFDVQFLEKFGVTFRREGETVTLKCKLLVTPDLKRVQPRAEWYRDGECGKAAARGRSRRALWSCGRGPGSLNVGVNSALLSSAAGGQAAKPGPRLGHLGPG